MTDLDIQTAQLIIQLAQDDIYQLGDDNALSDLEFALAEQEREFMQHWMDYGDARVNPGAPPRASGRSVSAIGGSAGNVNWGIGPSTANAVAHASATDDYEDTYALDIDYIDDTATQNTGPSASGSTVITTTSSGSSTPTSSWSPEPVASTSNTTTTASRRSATPENEDDGEDDPYGGHQPPMDHDNDVDDADSQPDSNITGFDSEPPEGPVARGSNLNLQHLDLLELLDFHFPGSNSSPPATRVIQEDIDDDWFIDSGPSTQRANAPVQTPSSRASTSQAVVGGRSISPPGSPQSDSSDIEYIGFLEPRSVECYFCKESCARSTTVTTSCGHHLCRTCTTRMVELCIKDETAYPPKCCGNKLETTELSIERKSGLRQRYEGKVREYETPVPSRVYCHRCGDFLDSDSTTITTGGVVAGGWGGSPSIIHTARYCGTCSLRTCVSCKQASHPGRVCQETQDELALKNLAKQKGWQTCPNCKAVVELRVGCYHMICRCTAQFCYLCAKTWKVCNCPAFEEARLVELHA